MSGTGSGVIEGSEAVDEDLLEAEAGLRDALWGGWLERKEGKRRRGGGRG